MKQFVISVEFRISGFKDKLFRIVVFPMLFTPVRIVRGASSICVLLEKHL